MSDFVRQKMRWFREKFQTFAASFVLHYGCQPGRADMEVQFPRGGLSENDSDAIILSPRA